VLTNLWVPDIKFEFSLTKQNEKHGLKFQYKWFSEFNWLCYFDVKKMVHFVNIVFYLPKVVVLEISH